MATKKPKLRTYDMRALYRSFEILKASGKLDEFLADCENNDRKVHLDLSTAVHTKECLHSVWPEVHAHHQSLLKGIFDEVPELAIGDGDCPSCPYLK